MRFALLSLVCLVAGCGGAAATPADGSAGQSEGGGLDVGPEVAPDPAACACQIDDTGALSLSWDCYCAQSYVGCDLPLGVSPDCAGFTRTDYPACGLTVIEATSGASADLPSVYDSSGRLVGRIAASDLTLYVCPSDPTLAGLTEEAGRFPAESCAAVSCGGCYAGSFPCPGPDAGADGGGED